MKKFSKITNQKINQEPVSKNESSEIDQIKGQMMTIMDRCLRIQSYGSVDHRYLSGSVKIEGKEMFLEALMDFLDNVMSKDRVAILESLKGDIRDWELLDNKIDQLNSHRPSIENKLSFKSILERYEEDSLVVFFESRNIENKETVLDYRILINESNISDEIKNRLLDILK